MNTGKKAGRASKKEIGAKPVTASPWGKKITDKLAEAKLKASRARVVESLAKTDARILDKKKPVERTKSVNELARVKLREETEKRLSRQREKIAKRLAGKPVESRVYAKPLTEDDIPKFLTKRVPGTSPVLATPYGKGETVTMPFPLADEALAEFRRLYPGLPATWANVSAAECDRLSARVNELLAANEALVVQRRKLTRERDTALRAASIMGRYIERRFGPMNEPKAALILARCRDINGETE